MRRIRIGLIGTGRFGRLHLKVLRQLPNVDVAALSDVNETALRRTASEYEVDPDGCYLDPEELIRREDLDAVDIVSDEASHGPLAAAALRAGKHVIVEKPLSVTFAEALEIEAAQAASGKQVLVGHISRFSQPYISIKRSIDDGRLGPVAAIRTKRNFSKAWFHGFGNRTHPVYESGVHEIDLIVWYARSRCVQVSAFERRMSGYAYPDLFSAMLTFENGIIATVDSSWLVPAGAPQNLVETLELDGTIDAHIEVIGENGTAQYQLAHPGLSVWTGEGVRHPETTLWPTGHDGVGGAIRAELEHFVRVIAENTPSAVMPLSEAVHVMEIAEAIQRSAATGSTVRLGGSNR